MKFWTENWDHEIERQRQQEIERMEEEEEKECFFKMEMEESSNMTMGTCEGDQAPRQTAIGDHTVASEVVVKTEIPSENGIKLSSESGESSDQQPSSSKDAIGGTEVKREPGSSDNQSEPLLQPKEENQSDSSLQASHKTVSFSSTGEPGPGNSSDNPSTASGGEREGLHKIGSSNSISSSTSSATIDYQAPEPKTHSSEVSSPSVI